MPLEGPWIIDNTERDNLYQYNGKEYNQEHGLKWQAYGARFYDPSIGRFTGVDPISDKFPHVTTYNYAENSPIANIDLWGLQAVAASALQGAYIRETKGNAAAEQHYKDVHKGTSAGIVAGSLFMPGPEDAVLGFAASTGWIYSPEKNASILSLIH